MSATTPQTAREFPEFTRPYTRNVYREYGLKREATPTPRKRRVARVRKQTLIGAFLRSRWMDDACAMIVAGSGLFFLVAIARMLLA